MTKPTPKKRKTPQSRNGYVQIRKRCRRWVYDRNGHPRMARYYPLKDPIDEEHCELPDLSTLPRPTPGGEPVVNVKLREDLARAAVAGRLDFIRAVFEDPALVKTATYAWLPKEGRCGCTREYRQQFSPANIEAFCEVRFVRVPIFIHACEHGNLEVVQYLLENGADINKFMQKCSGRTPLLAACRSGFEDVACLLISRGAAITPIETEVTHHRDYDEYYGETVSLDTPLTWASVNGMVTTVETMINHGMLNALCTGDKDEDTVGLTGDSVRATLNKLLFHVTKGRLDRSDQINCSRVIEILGQSGVSVYSVHMEAEKSSRHYDEFADKKLLRRLYRPFFTEGCPEPHTLGIIRGLRHVDLDVLKVSGVKVPDMKIDHLIDFEWKKRYWDGEVELATERETDEGEYEPKCETCWMDLVLEASKPWSRHNHRLFPVAVRKLAWELFLVGWKLGQDGLFEDSCISQVWENNVVPFLIG